VLNTLVFPVDNPENRIEEINLTILDQKRKYEVARDIYNFHNDEYMEWWNINKNDIEYIEQEGIPLYTTKELQGVLEGMTVKLVDLKTKDAKQNVLTERLENINGELSEIDIILSEQIDVENLECRLEFSLKREKLLRSPYFSIDVKTRLFEESDYLNILEQEYKFNRYQSALKKYKINEEDFLDELSDLKDLTSRANTDFYPLVERKRELKNQLPDITPPRPDNNFTWDDLLVAKEYELIEKHNSRINARIDRYKLNLPIDQIKEIVRNEGKYVLIQKKKELKRSEEHTSELQSPVPISYAVFCLKKKTKNKRHKRQ